MPRKTRTTPKPSLGSTSKKTYRAATPTGSSNRSAVAKKAAVNRKPKPGTWSDTGPSGSYTGPGGLKGVDQMPMPRVDPPRGKGDTARDGWFGIKPKTIKT